GYYQAELAGMKNKDNFSNLDEFIAVDSRPKLRYENVTEGVKRDFPLQLNIFDALRIENDVIANLPLSRRREILENIVSQDPEEYVRLTKQFNVSNEKEMQELFLNAVSKGYEGLIAKDPNSLYLPGSVNDDWMKMKDWLTLDLAILGFYDTDKSINNGQLFSAMLVGSYNLETKKFETVSKISSPSFEDQKKIYSLVEFVNTDGDFNKVLEANDEIYFNPKMQKIGKKVPNRIVVNDPRIMPIVEVQCLNVTYSDNFHSCGNCYEEGMGHSLRIGSYKRLREDKLGIKDMNTTQDLHELYLGLK
ncbi:hypothetical protein KY334_04040, partial [Candidatus Woesearchaeota archaeon]|nr:hypothetical protein [Candidatus Woesearchaeota archaeon]